MTGTLTPRARGTLFVLCGALFLDALDVSMKGVALPSIGADLDLPTGALQWVVSAYTLGFGGLLLLGGRTADVFGRRRVFLASLVVFVIASAAGGLADSGPLLVLARFVTGVSAAFTAPAGLAIITTGFAEGPARNRALTVYSATGASGFASGLVIGGALTEIDWRTVFFLPAVLAAAIAAGAARLIPAETRGPRPGGIDVPGAVTATTALLALVLALVRVPHADSLGLLALAALLGTGFVIIERHTRTPLVRPELLHSGALLRTNIGAMALLGGWIGTLFVITVHLQQVRGWSPLQTGLAVAPSGTVVALLAPRITAPLVGRFGTTPMIVAGLGAAALAYGLLLPLGPHTSYPATMLPAFLLVGVAFVLAYGPLTIAATAGVDAGAQGVAGGLVNTSFQIGPALALAAVAAVIDATADLRTALIVPLAVTVTGLAVVATGLRTTATTNHPSI